MSAAIFTVLIVAAVIIEAVTTPFFLKAQRPGANPKSLTLKMICATMFLLIGVLSYFYSGNTSEFAKFMVIGLASSWLGDFFLHLKKDGKINFGIGFVFFASAHILYLIAYSKATGLYFPERSFFTAAEIIAVILLVILMFFFYKKVGNINMLSPMMLVFVVYGFILLAMFVKAVVFSAEYIAGDFANAVSGGLCLAFGGTLFCLSDLSMVLLMFNEKFKKNHRLKDFNIGSYFMAQTLLALTVLFIGF